MSALFKSVHSKIVFREIFCGNRRKNVALCHWTLKYFNTLPHRISQSKTSPLATDKDRIIAYYGD